MNFNYNEILSRNLAFLKVDDVFTEEECLQIIEAGQMAGLEDSLISDGSGSDAIRKSKSSFLRPFDNNLWFFERIMSAANWANELFFQFDLYGFSSAQYTEYGSEGDFYGWHKDLLFNPNAADLQSTIQSRKLSASVILSHRDEYLGGEFHVERDPENNAVTAIPQNIGSIIFFPSFVDHQVTPVTYGTRKSLVIWIEGPKFK
jgi:PKHD-type hydroxylase